MELAILDDGADFWRFSLVIYGMSGVASACLLLQDRHGLDVNLALYCCWLGTTGRGRIDAARLAAADAAIASWRRDIVEPLRQVRRALKSISDVDADAHALGERAKAIELEAERVEQVRLAALAPKMVTTDAARCLGDAIENLRTYLGSAQGDAEPLIAALRSLAGSAA